MKQTHAGFTIIETMVAIGILGTMLFSAIGLMVQVNDAVAQNERTIVATYLAQECQEMVRNVRDSAWRQNLRWNCGFEAQMPAGGAAYYALDNQNLVGGDTPSCLVPAAPDEIKGPHVEMGAFASTTGADESNFEVADIPGPFYRSVQFFYDEKPPYIDSIDPNCTNANSESCEAVLAECRVWWYDGSAREEVEITQTLTNWYRR